MELKDVMDTLQKQVDGAFEKYHGQLAETGKVANETRDELRALTEKHAEVTAIVERMEQSQADRMERAGKVAKSVTQALMESGQFKAFKDGNSGKCRIELADHDFLGVKNTILGEGGNPQNPVNTLVPEDRRAGIIPGAFRQLRIIDTLPSSGTTSNLYQYTRELAFTNAASETLEGAQKPETDLTFELVEAPVRTVAHFLKASKQVLDDAPSLESYINNRLRYGVELKMEQQVVNGPGTGNTISGFIGNSSNHTAFTGSATAGLDRINEAKYQVIGNDYAPSVVYINPADWGAIERERTSAGSYTLGDGAAVTYVMNGMVPVVWGLPVVASNSIPQGTFAVMDAMAALEVKIRQGVAVEMFEQDEDNVQRNLITIRAEARGLLATYVPAAVVVGDIFGS